MKVLIVGRHQGYMDSVLAQLRDEGFDADGYIEDEKIITELQSGICGVLAICGGVEPDSKVAFRQEVAKHSPHTRVLEVYMPDTLLPGLKRLRQSE